MGLDITKFSDAKSEATETGTGSSHFRNIAFCSPDSHAEKNDIPLDHFFLNEGDSSDLESSTMTDLGETVDYIYILDWFQYYEWRDEDDNDALAFNSFQFKNSFNPLIIRNVSQKTIDALPFWSKEDDCILNEESLKPYKRSGRYNIWAIAKLDGEWKRVKIKASASTIHGAVFDEKKKRPAPLFKEEPNDSLIGFMRSADEEIGKGFAKMMKCKLALGKVGSRNRRITFESVGVASEEEAEIVSKNFAELKEAIGNENAGKLGFFVEEMVDWSDVHNKEYLAAYLQNPLSATYNVKSHIDKFMLPERESAALLESGLKTEAQKSVDSFDEDDVQVEIVGADDAIEEANEVLSKKG